MSEMIPLPSPTAQAIRQRVAEINAIRATDETRARAEEQALLREFVELVAGRAPEPFRRFGKEMQQLYK